MINCSANLNALRHQYLDYLTQVKTLTKQVDLPDNGLTELSQRIQHTELLVPVVGGFSAGKSTLLNSFLGSSLLPTAITPETALATELRYSHNDYIEAVTEDDRIERYELSQLVEIKDNAQNFKFLRLFLNNPNLAAIEPLVLVDMPGFDAPIENHNKAILDYLNRGTHFVFLTSVEDGTITRTMHQEIKNLHLFGKSFSFGISKTDLRAPEDVQKVKDAISEHLATQYDYSGNVALFDTNGGENLKQILTAIRPELLFKSLFIHDLKENHFKNEDSLNLKISTLKSDKSQSESAIQRLISSIEKIKEKQEQSIKDVEQRYSTHSIEHIVNSVGKAISEQRISLVSLAMNNPEEFQRVLNDLVKNNLLAEVKNKIESLSSDIIQDFKVDLHHNFSGHSELELGESFVQKMADSAELLLKKANSGLKDLSQSMDNTVATQKNVTALYRSVATILGITTSIVNPAVEIALIFLPEIISFFTQRSKEEQARRQLEEHKQQVEQKLIMEIIPQIKGKIRTELPSLIKQNAEQIIQQIATQFEEQLSQKQAEIEQAVAEKEQKAGEIDALIEQLQTVKLELNQAAQAVIFA